MMLPTARVLGSALMLRTARLLRAVERGAVAQASGTEAGALTSSSAAAADSRYLPAVRPATACIISLDLPPCHTYTCTRVEVVY